MIPKNADKSLIGDRAELRQAFTRTAILSNEKYRGVRLKLTENNLEITANNPEQEQAEEVVAVQYAGSDLEIGFNARYLQELTSQVDGKNVEFSFKSSGDPALMKDIEDEGAIYVVMPMRV